MSYNVKECKPLPAGIAPSSAVLIACWCLLLCEALVLAEVNVAGAYTRPLFIST